MKRYFITKILDKKAIRDRQQNDQIIATCLYAEQATLVCNALNRNDIANKNDAAMAQELYGITPNVR